MIKRGSLLESSDHVLRHVKKKLIIRDIEGNVEGVYPQAFELREGEEYLSVNWIEHFEKDQSTNITQTIQEFRKHFSVGKENGFMLANVGELEAFFSNRKIKPRITYWPTEDPTHSAVFHTTNELAFLEEIVDKVFNKPLILNTDIAFEVIESEEKT